MRIIHYLIGLPPLRGGGMIGYALDSAKEQQRQGNEVSLLIPGEIHGRRNPHVEIRKRRAYNGIPMHAVINPLPIPMGNGIRDIPWFTFDAGYESYAAFFRREKPDVLHVHSLMGVHRSMLAAAGASGTAIVCTTHDYYGICPCTIMMCGDAPCDAAKRIRECPSCCRNAFSTGHLLLDQSPVGKAVGMAYSRLGIRSIRMPGAGKGADAQQETKETDAAELDQYRTLSEDFLEKFSFIDYFHFNSEQTEKIYRQFLGNIKGQRLGILSSYCRDARTIRQTDSDVLRLGYMGAMRREKGCDALQEAVEQVRQEGVKAELYWCCAGRGREVDYIHCLPPYRTYRQFTESLANVDLMVIPSTWYETFGLTAAEAVSLGIPVLLTDRVGAKDLLKDHDIGWVIDGDAGSLRESIAGALRGIWEEPALLEQWNRNICRADMTLDFAEHIRTMTHVIYKEARSSRKDGCTKTLSGNKKVVENEKKVLL
jgi:glycosyltransferase involved in cell wall biosynthesis